MALGMYDLVFDVNPEEIWKILAFRCPGPAGAVGMALCNRGWNTQERLGTVIFVGRMGSVRQYQTKTDRAEKYGYRAERFQRPSL